MTLHGSQGLNSSHRAFLADAFFCSVTQQGFQTRWTERLPEKTSFKSRFPWIVVPPYKVSLAIPLEQSFIGCLPW